MHPAATPARTSPWAGRAFAVALGLSAVVLFSPSSGGVALFPGADKVVHVAVFALLAGATRWRFGPQPVVLVLLAAYAAASEVVQAVVLADRSGDVLDVVADLVGVAVGWSVGRRWSERPG